jgi:hypothetical protein
MFSRVSKHVSKYLSKIRKNQQTKKKSPGNDEIRDMYEPFTSDGKAPYVVYFVNAHGAMNDVKKPSRPNENKNTDIEIHAYSIAGNENQCGLMGIVQPQKEQDEFYNFAGKGIDFCIPSVLRSVFYDDGKQKGTSVKSTSVFDRYTTAINKVKDLYFHTNPTYTQLHESGGFQVMTEPTRYHEYQLYGNKSESSRKRTSSNQRQMLMRTAANDTKFSDKMIYGVWLVSTNIKILEPLALTSISDSELKLRKENKPIQPDKKLYVPPEVMNRINMASRKDGISLGAEFWKEAIYELRKQYGSLDSVVGPDGINHDNIKLRIRARTALDNLWKRRTTNSHDIIDIFTPFNEVGKKLGFARLSMYTIDVTCRSNVGELEPPNPYENLHEMPIKESQDFEFNNTLIPVEIIGSTDTPPPSKHSKHSKRTKRSPVGQQQGPSYNDDSLNDSPNEYGNKGGTKRKLKYWRKLRTIRNKYQHRHKKSKKSGKRNV